MKTEDIITKLANYEPTILGYERFKRYALLLPLVNINNEVHLLFEVRSLTMRSQPGDICFPGGKIDETDRDELYCALRETEEELGLSKQYIKHVTPLDYMVNDFGRVIYPFVGEVTSLEQMELNKKEVAEVFTVPLAYFLENEPEKYKIRFDIVPEDNFPFHLIQGGKDYEWRPRSFNELFYEYNERVIWGLTARIIYHFVSILNNKFVQSR